MAIVRCNNIKCAKEFVARQADINRGWGKYCCKSCKAMQQTRNIKKVRHDMLINKRNGKMART